MYYEDDEALTRPITDWSRIKTRKPINTARRDHFMWLVCHYFEVFPEQLKGPRRLHNICVARFVLCYLLREDCKMTWGAIARYLNKDHSTIIYNHRRALANHLESIAIIRGKMAAGACS